MQQPLWLGILVLLFLPSVLPILMMSIPLVGAIVAVFYCLGPSATGKAPREGSPAQSSPSQPATGEAPKPSDGAICSSESPNLSAPSHTPHSTSFNILPTDASASPGHSAHAPLTGSAALLARMRADRSKPVPTTKNLVVLYASQTGTAQEIAKGIAAEAASSGLQAKVTPPYNSLCLLTSSIPSLTC